MKTKLLIEYHSNNVRKPILSEAIKTSDVVLNILKAAINGQMHGRIFAEIEGSSSEISSFMNYLSANDVTTEIRQSLIEVSPVKCSGCGACCEACPTEALTLTGMGAALEFEPYKCVSCDRCIELCPVGAIKEV